MSVMLTWEAWTKKVNVRGLWSVNLDETVPLALSTPKITKKYSTPAKEVVRSTVKVKVLAKVVGKATVFFFSIFLFTVLILFIQGKSTGLYADGFYSSSKSWKGCVSVGWLITNFCRMSGEWNHCSVSYISCSVHLSVAEKISSLFLVLAKLWVISNASVVKLLSVNQAKLLWKIMVVKKFKEGYLLHHNHCYFHKLGINYSTASKALFVPHSLKML